jgi:hypothetical protein
MLLAFVALVTKANSQSKYVLITPDSLNNTVKLDYYWNWHILRLSDSTYYMNTWGVVDTNVVAQNYQYSSKIYNIIDNSINRYRLEFDTSGLVFPGCINGLSMSNNHILSLNKLEVYFYDSGVVKRQMARPLLTKLDLSNNKIWSNIYGDSSKYYDCASVKEIGNYYYVLGTRSVSISPAVDKQFCLIKIDTSGVLILEKVYPFVPREYASNLELINERLYINGNRVIPPYDEDKIQHIIKKIDAGGNLLNTTSLPFKLNSGSAQFSFFRSNYNNNSYLVSFNEENEENVLEFSTLNHKDIRYRIIDTNFTVIKTIIIKRDLPMILRSVNKIGEDKFLLTGAKYLDSSRLQLGAWACIIDTSGKLIWDITYSVRASANHYLTDGCVTKDGGFLLTGTVGPLPSAGLTKDGILIKVDSLGCLDTTGCYPLGLATIAKNNLNIKAYPNPFTNNVVIELPIDLNNNKEIIINDLFGKQIIKKETNNNTVEIESSSWPNGTYFVTIRYCNNSYNYKILKQ